MAASGQGVEILTHEERKLARRRNERHMVRTRTGVPLGAALVSIAAARAAEAVDLRPWSRAGLHRYEGKLSPEQLQMRKAVEQRAFAVEGKLENISFLKGNGTYQVLMKLGKKGWPTACVNADSRDTAKIARAAMLATKAALSVPGGLLYVPRKNTGLVQKDGLVHDPSVESWQVKIRVAGKDVYPGTFKDKAEATLVHDKLKAIDGLSDTANAQVNAVLAWAKQLPSKSTGRDGTNRKGRGHQQKSLMALDTALRDGSANNPVRTSAETTLAHVVYLGKSKRHPFIKVLYSLSSEPADIPATLCLPNSPDYDTPKLFERDLLTHGADYVWVRATTQCSECSRQLDSPDEPTVALRR